MSMEANMKTYVPKWLISLGNGYLQPPWGRHIKGDKEPSPAPVGMGTLG